VWRKRGFLQVETHREFFAPYPTPRSARLKTSQSRMTTLRRTTTMGIRALLGFSLLSLAISTWSYAIGYQIAESVKRQGLDVDIDALVQAIRDDLGGKELQISLDEMRTAVVAYQQKVTQELAQKNRQVGNAFLAENKKKEGTVQTASGLQYQVMQAGSGALPRLHDCR
jgi:hypothetical protein